MMISTSVFVRGTVFPPNTVVKFHSAAAVLLLRFSLDAEPVAFQRSITSAGNRREINLRGLDETGLEIGAGIQAALQKPSHRTPLFINDAEPNGISLASVGHD